MLNNLSKNKKIIIIIIGVVLILAIATAIVLPILLNKNDNKGYSYDDENKPLQYDAVSKMVFYKKFSNILKYTFFIVDKNSYIANGFLDAMSRARIPTEKMLAFADYIIEFGDIIMKSGFYIPEGEFDPEKQKESSLFKNFNYHFIKFFQKTGFTELELSRFIYEIIIGISGESEYNELLLQLGRDDFVTLTANTIYGYKMIMAATTQSIEPIEARSLQAIVYSLGSAYLNVIEKMGFDGVEKLLCINFDSQKQYPHLTEEEQQLFTALTQTLEGKIANVLYIFGKALTNTDAYAFEQLFSYFSSEDKTSLESKENFIISNIEISKAIKQAIESSFVFKNKSNISTFDSFVTEYAKLIRQYKQLTDIISQSDEEINYDQYQNELKMNITDFLDALTYLSNIQSLQGMTLKQIDTLFNQAVDMWKIFENMDGLFDNTFSMMFVNFLLKIIDAQGFLESNRRAIEDLIRDSLAGLIDEDALEGIADF